jgi:hypothetical protein
VSEPSPGRVRAARVIAFLADAIQLGAFPLFAAGVASPWNDVLDVVVAALMIGLLGWHWAFLPTIVAESVPLVGLVPTWTAAVFLVTRGVAPPAPAPPLPPGAGAPPAASPPPGTLPPGPPQGQG